MARGLPFELATRVMVTADALASTHGESASNASCSVEWRVVFQLRGLGYDPTDKSSLRIQRPSIVCATQLTGA